MRRAPFEAFLTSNYRGERTGAPLADRSAQSYGAYVAKAEQLIGCDVDTLDLSAQSLPVAEAAVRRRGAAEGSPANTVDNCISGLRAYAQFRTKG